MGTSKLAEFGPGARSLSHDTACSSNVRNSSLPRRRVGRSQPQSLRVSRRDPLPRDGVPCRNDPPNPGRSTGMPCLWGGPWERVNDFLYFGAVMP
jgi:hypothetical protein